MTAFEKLQEEIMLFEKNEKKIEREKIIPRECLEVLKNPDLFKEITEDEFDKKIVGENESRKVIFLCAAGGRLVINHQIASYNILINDEAGTGKDYVGGKVLEILPKEVYIHKTRISPTVFTYWHSAKSDPTWTWDGRVFYPEDISENVLNSDVFKVMCSSGSSATIVINQMAVEIEIKGKPVIITTTATATPNPELIRRLLILNLDSSEDQTKLIMRRHSEYKRLGIVPEYDEKYKKAMNYQERVKVKIPFANLIDSFFPSNNVVMRTHYPRFLDYIAASAAFHQFQRQRDREDFVLAESQDYEIARDCFLKVCSNKYMIPLTINQKKILQIFENNPLLNGTIAELHGDKLSFLSDRALQTNLQIMVKYGIIEIFVKTDSLNREREAYKFSTHYKPQASVTIPKFKELISCNNPSVSSISNLSSETSITSPSNHKEQIERNAEDIEDCEAIKCPEEVVDCRIRVKLTDKHYQKCISCDNKECCFECEDHKLYCSICVSDETKFVKITGDYL